MRGIDEVFDSWRDAWANKDRELWLELMHPDVELYLPRSAIEGTVYRGLEGASQAFSDGFDSWPRMEIAHDWTMVREQGDWHLGKIRARLHPRGPGPAVEFEAYWLARLYEGTVIYAHPYQDPDEAIEAFDAAARG